MWRQSNITAFNNRNKKKLISNQQKKIAHCNSIRIVICYFFWYVSGFVFAKQNEWTKNKTATNVRFLKETKSHNGINNNETKNNATRFLFTIYFLCVFFVRSISALLPLFFSITFFAPQYKEGNQEKSCESNLKKNSSKRRSFFSRFARVIISFSCLTPMAAKKKFLARFDVMSCGN